MNGRILFFLLGSTLLHLFIVGFTLPLFWNSTETITLEVKYVPAKAVAALKSAPRVQAHPTQSSVPPPLAKAEEVASPTPDSAPASALSSSDIGIMPVYPRLSRILGEEGRVTLRIDLHTDGSFRAAQVEESSGFPRIDQAAVSAVRDLRLDKKTSDGPVRVTFIFKLKSSPNP